MSLGADLPWILAPAVSCLGPMFFLEKCNPCISPLPYCGVLVQRWGNFPCMGRVEEFLGRNNSSISILLSFLSPPPVRTSPATFIHPISSYIETGARATTFQSPWDCDCLQFAGGKDLCTSSHLVTALQQLPAKRTFLFRFSLYSSRFTEHRERKTPAGSTKNEQSKAALYCWQSLGSSAEARYATLLSHLGFRLSLWKQEC